jgi:hypothetical protein
MPRVLRKSRLIFDFGFWFGFWLKATSTIHFVQYRNVGL